MAGLGGCNVGSVCSSEEHTHLEAAFENWFRLLGVGAGGGIYVTGEVTRVSAARFVWLCTIVQDRGVGRYFIRILRGEGMEGEKKSYKARQRVKGDSCLGNKFLLGLRVGQAYFLAPGWERGESQHLTSSSGAEALLNTPPHPHPHPHSHPLFILGHYGPVRSL